MANNKGDFMVGLLIGGALGAALAILYAPQSGEETRTQLKKKGGELKDTAGEAYGKARERAVEVGGTVKSKTTHLASAVRDTTSNLAAKVGEKMRRTGDTLVAEAEAAS